MFPILRCSSLAYSRYSRSSRLASWAPRQPRCDAALPFRAARERLRHAVVCLGLAASVAAPTVRAQVLPSEPIQLADGQVVLGGLVAGAVSAPVDGGFFNYTDYRHNALRVLRLSVSASALMGERVALLGEIQTENFDTLRPYAFYARVRPWIDRSIDIQAGRIPPTSRRRVNDEGHACAIPPVSQYARRSVAMGELRQCAGAAVPPAKGRHASSRRDGPHDREP